MTNMMIVMSNECDDFDDEKGHNNKLSCCR